MTAPNSATALASVVVDELTRSGIGNLVLAPGSRSAAVALAAAAHPGMSVWVEIDERSAAFFALGLWRRGSGCAVLTTSGTASANVYPAIIEADQAQTPLLALTADRPHELRSTGANQTIDQLKLYSERVRWFAELPVPEDRPGEPGFWRATVCRAVAEARGRAGTPGPVQLNLCFREPLVPVTHDGRSEGAVYRNNLDGRPGNVPWTDALISPRRPVRLPDLSGRVLVIAGLGADEPLVAGALAAGCAVIAEGHSGLRLPGTITTYHHLLSSSRVVAAGRPDHAVVLGRAGLSPHLARLLAGVEITAVGPGWWDPDRRAARMIPAGTWGRLEPDRAWTDRWLAAERVARAIVDTEVDAGDAVNEARVARDTLAAVPDEGVLVVGSSMPVRDLDWFGAGRRGVEVVGNRGASGIDGLVSLALGVAAARRGPVVGLTGDLSLLHDQNGFLVRPRPDLVLVVVNNDGGGIFSFLPQADFPNDFERLFATPTGVGIEALAAIYGLGHTLIERGSELRPAVESALAAGGCHVVEAKTDRAHNVAFHRNVTAQVVGAVEHLFEG